MSLLAPSDFIGIVEQSVNKHTTPKIQLYIDRFEKKYLTDLLGATEYDSFIADLNPTPAVTTSVPTSAKFTVIFEPIATDDGNTNGCKHISEGIKDMLKLFIMFEYAVDNQYDFTLIGATKGTFSNSEVAKLNMTNAIDNYNEGLKSYKTIQWYICDNPLDYDYEDYNGQDKETMSWL